MTDFTLASADISTILKEVAADVRDHVEELRELDAVSGDGDMGITIELGSGAISAYFKDTEENDVGKMLAECGMNINRASPSTFGTLLASAFLGAGQAVRGKDIIDTNDLLLMGSGAIDGIKKRGKAEVGDKTMLDSLVPAVEAFRKTLEQNSDVPQAIKAAVEAAEAGMQATVNMRAKHGRASRHRQGEVKVRDAGATAIYYLIESFTRHLIN